MWSLTSFTFRNETEQKIDDTLYETIKLYVPKGKVDAYKATDGWKKFKNILEMADASPITITAEDKTIEYGEALPEFTYKSEGAHEHRSDSWQRQWSRQR